MILKRISAISILLLSTGLLLAQKVQKNVDYINKYAKIAVQQMELHKIPASITLAQGLLESQSGSSRLATKGNNHFGIKCSNWTGATIYHDDEKKGECFRKYDNVFDSYEDHSLFLTTRSRYAILFTLKTTDYKGWAKGLQKCGYATDKSYPDKLIKIIEDYELYSYDTQKSSSLGNKNQNSSYSNAYQGHTIQKVNGLNFVVARSGDTFKSLGSELGYSARKIRNYNELPKDYSIKEGDIMYLERKNRKAQKTAPAIYIIKAGDSMYSISQKYGIRLKKLYKLNNKQFTYRPAQGDRIKLR